eukprot:jgi/Psemu1/246447/estExt_Genewise1.C_7930004
MEQRCEEEESAVPQGNGSQNNEIEEDKNDNIQINSDDDFDPRQGFLGGFERSSASGAHAGDGRKNNREHDHSNGTNHSKNEKADALPSSANQSLREIREEKVAEARKRYLKRKQALISEQ